ncbi:MAG TPA: DUF2318 domain-containing protein [Blastocatellia bacterium]|nr:DUF2318 domain-containing protein [Blastocatellia bacterium]
MSNKHYSHEHHSRERKRAQFAKPSEQKISSTAILVMVFTALLALALYLVLGSSNATPGTTSVVATNASASIPSSTRAQNASASETGDVLIPISDVSNGKANFFNYTASNKTFVRFFVIKSSDGVYRAALDACDVCYAAKKGYYQDGDNMICKKCGRDFPSALVNEVTGGCNPIGVPRAVDGDNLVIKASDLETGKSYF